MAITNITKSGSSNSTNLARIAASPKRYAKAGSGWDYDQPEITYDGEFDPITGLPVLYDSLGIMPVITNLAKNAV
jgi:hypothetical protein